MYFPTAKLRKIWLMAKDVIDIYLIIDILSSGIMY